MSQEGGHHDPRSKTKDEEGKTIVGWASTKRGSRFPILEGQDKAQALADHMDALQGRDPHKHEEELRGETITQRDEETKKFVKRFGIAKTSFKIREEVIFDNFTRKGLVSGFSGDSINIVAKDGRTYSREKTLVFKASELINGNHWDAMTLNARLELLKSHNVSDNYLNSSWYFIPYQVRNILQKAMGPAGYEGGGVSTYTSGVYNPVHQEKTVSEKMKEEQSKPKKQPTVGELDESEENKVEEDVDNREQQKEIEHERGMGSGKQEPKHYTITEVKPEPHSPQEEAKVPPHKESEETPSDEHKESQIIRQKEKSPSNTPQKQEY